MATDTLVVCAPPSSPTEDASSSPLRRRTQRKPMSCKEVTVRHIMEDRRRPLRQIDMELLESKGVGDDPEVFGEIPIDMLSKRSRGGYLAAQSTRNSGSTSTQESGARVTYKRVGNKSNSDDRASRRSDSYTPPMALPASSESDPLVAGAGCLLQHNKRNTSPELLPQTPELHSA